MAKKEQQHKNEILENPEALAHTLVDAETWIEQHSKTVIGVAAVLILVAGGYFAFRYYTKSQDSEAQKQMFQAVYYFEQDSFKLALEGDGNNLGFLDIAKEFSVTDAG